MHFAKTTLASLALAGAVSAAPTLTTRQDSAITDAQILNYALTLEHFEATFYGEGLNMYNAGAFEGKDYPDWVRYRLTEIANEEATHVGFLTSALEAANVTATAQCTYDFGITSPETFIALAQIFEGVGVSAYLGAAPFISNKDYLLAAASILVVEANHDTWVRSGADNLDPVPNPFAVPLQFSQVYSLVAPFIKSCPSSNPTLPVKAFPSIKVETTGTYKPGEKIKIEVPSGASYAAFVYVAGVEYTAVSEGTATITIPEYATGQSYLILTSSKAITDAATVAGPAILEVPVQATTFPYQGNGYSYPSSAYPA